MKSFSGRAAVWGGVAVLALAGAVNAAQTNAPSPADKTAEVAKLMRMADSYHQAGDSLKAARLYELIAKRYPDTRRSVAGRVCRLYAASGVTNAALAWAAEVMRVHPDPQVFLAGIQVALKNPEAAAGILEQQLAVAPTPQRRISLLWQLGDVREKQGEFEKARQAFAGAVNVATSAAERDAAQRRLEKFAEMQKATAAAAAARKPVAAATNAPARPGGGQVKGRKP
jgi:uncharacterized protein HemY